MTYKIIIKKRARKFIEKQTPKIRNNILKAIYVLPDGDIKAMQGNNDLYRLRIGDIRVIYSIDNSIVTIIVTDADNRGDIYKRY